MNIISFGYTKENGDKSERVIIKLKEPCPNYFGIDISELDLEDQVAFDEAFSLLKEEHASKINDLMVKFDVKHNFRTFKPERMENIIKE